MSIKRGRANVAEKALSFEEQQLKVNDTRKLIIGPLADKLPTLCSDASIIRYLKARNWNVKKAAKMLKETLEWRLEYKPEKIRWDEIAHEAETGKIYRASYCDKHERTVLVMRPGFQNTTSTKGQIRYLVYCIENAILNLKPGQEQMVWLIDFQGWNTSSISVKVTRETAHILQDHYPERLGLGILYNPPKLFESFWKMVKPFIEKKTFKKVRFVYSDDTESQKIMDELFDKDKLESAFGGRNSVGFNYDLFSQQMKEDDKKMSKLIESSSSLSTYEIPTESRDQQLETLVSDHSSEMISDEGEFSSDDASSNLEAGNEKRQDPPLTSKDTSLKDVQTQN